VIDEGLIRVEWKRMLKRLGRTPEYAWRRARWEDRRRGGWLASREEARLLVYHGSRGSEDDPVGWCGEEMTCAIVSVWVMRMSSGNDIVL